jgi:hypothetical protein
MASSVGSWMKRPKEVIAKCIDSHNGGADKRERGDVYVYIFIYSHFKKYFHYEGKKGKSTGDHLVGY